MEGPTCFSRGLIHVDDGFGLLRRDAKLKEAAEGQLSQSENLLILFVHLTNSVAISTAIPPSPEASWMIRHWFVNRRGEGGCGIEFPTRPADDRSVK
jgi:hypothetical protein